MKWNSQEIGIGCGLNFILIKNIMDLSISISTSGNLFSAIIKVFWHFILFNKKERKIYFQRLSGLINSILGKKSWYRPKIFIN